MVKIVDYQMGNMFSIQGACNKVGLEAMITSDLREITQADALILPGVGAFDEAMGNLRRLDLVEPIKDFVQTGKPFLGICLGMQLLFSQSEEFGCTNGLDIVQGAVEKLPSSLAGKALRVPHIGWNRIYPSAGQPWESTILSKVDPGEFMYFAHSFHCKPADDLVTLSMTSYDGFEFCSSIRFRNIHATQFHPEKSAQHGINIYKNWAEVINTTKEKE